MVSIKAGMLGGSAFLTAPEEIGAREVANTKANQ